MDTWLPIFQSLRPFLRPVGSSCESHLDFFHRAVSKAVRLRYLSKEAAGRSSPGVSPREGAQQSGPWRERDERRYTFWHGRLADFFEHCTDAQRRAEELPYHLEKVLDNSGLLRSIVQWEVFSRLATVSRGLELMRFCRAAGGYGAVAVALREQLELASAGGLSSERLASRKLLVAEFLTQAGEAGHAISILEESLRESRLRQRPATRALLLGLLADAMLVQICFGRMSAQGVRQVPLILEEAVSLWRSVSEGERDEAALAQALSNLCYQYSQVGPTQLAEAAGREAIDIYSRLGHPRLAQAEQHMGHVLHRKRMDQEAMAMYRRSVNTFERFGTARFDTEHACSLSSIATLMDDARGLVAWQRAAVASCEAITGRDHQEAAHYRRQLAVYLEAVGETEEAQRVADGGDVAVSAEDIEVMRSSSG